MTYDFNSLEPLIWSILSAPDINLDTISARRVRRQLSELDSSLTAQFLKENKDDVDIVIGRVYEKVSAGKAEGSRRAEETEVTRKRKQGDEPEDELEDGRHDTDEDHEGEQSPPSKKAKKIGKRELSDAELARKLNDEINSRSRRSTATKARGNGTGAGKKGNKTKKSSTTVDSDNESEDGVVEKKTRKKGGSAKGGFGKEYVLSEPLAALLDVDRLSRPQVVKQLWGYIKNNELQNPTNKKEIICDAKFKSVFAVDKIDMFKMNQVLGQHLHESES